MTELNSLIRDIPMPARIARLPISEAGFPIPWFVPYSKNGQPVPQAADPVKRMAAHRAKLCWCCGEYLGKFLAFVIGPMCTVTRTTSEPPSHRECAEYAVRACPYLANPRMRRNPTFTGETENPGGIMIERNPKVSVIWMTYEYHPFRDPEGRVLFSIGDPVAVTFMREGRRATRAEILESMDTGMPLLRAHAHGREANEALDQQYARALKLVPDDPSPLAAAG